MSFSGDLESLPIVDVLQLLHASRKSGMLRVRGRRGESQLVFKDGCIVSASHLNNSVRIGQVLVDMGVITTGALESALNRQQEAGGARKPLVVTLVEMGLAREEDAYRGLEHLIEQTIVEILQWKRGTFLLESKPPAAADGYCYYPERLSQEIVVDTQGVLMDALRVYDEKRRDGELQEEEEDEPAVDGMSGLTADDLGLGELELLEHLPPSPFSAGDTDPLQLQRQRLRELAPHLAGDLLERLAVFLHGVAVSTAPLPAHGGMPALIAYTPDEFLGYCLGTACCSAGMFSCTVSDSQQLATVRDRCAVLNSAPLILFDDPRAAEGFDALRSAALAQLKEPLPPLLQLVADDDGDKTLDAYAAGFQAVIPKPSLPLRNSEDLERLIRFLGSVRTLVDRCASHSASRVPARLRASLARFLERPQPQSVAAVLLQQLAEISPRALTLVVRDGALAAEKGIGISGEGRIAVQAPACRIPLQDDTPLGRVINEGRIVSGTLDEPLLERYLFPVIGAPRVPVGILLPLRHRGRTLAVIYGDFGEGVAAAVNIELLDLLGAMASLVLDGTTGSAVR